MGQNQVFLQKSSLFFCERPRKWVSQMEISALCETCTQGCMYLKLVTKQARSNLIFSWSKHLINLRKPVLEVCPLWQGLLSNDGGQKISGNFDF